MASGGARKGTGPKLGSKFKTTLNREQEREILRTELIQHKQVYIESLVAAMKDKQVPAMKEYAERVWGKERDNIEHSGDMTFSGVVMMPAPGISDE